MNKKEIAETLRKEVGELEVAIKKVQGRCDKLKQFVMDLEDEIAGPARPAPGPENKLRKVIDSVFGEKNKEPKR